MVSHQKVWKGGAISLICLVLFTFNTAAWSADAMQADMDQTFESKFGPSFEQNFDTATQDSDDDSSSDNTDVQRMSALDDSYWNAFSDRMSELDSNDRTTQQTRDDTTTTQTQDSVLDDSFWSNFERDTTRDSSSDDSTTDRQTRDTTDDRTSDDTTTRDSSGSNDGQTSVSPSGSTEEKAEEYLHRYINQERQERGLAPLNFDSDLRSTARIKSQDMARRGYFSHSDPEGDNFRDIYNENGISRSECRVGAENIARTWFNRNVRTDTGSTVNYDNAQELADGLRRQWMTSSAHRDAILRSRYNSHGLGVEITSSGRVYATEHFCA